MNDVFKAALQFDIDGEPIHIERYGDGHIHDTYAVYFKNPVKKPFRVIIQKINTRIFHNPHVVMENITAVTNFLSEKIKSGDDAERYEVLTVIPTKNGLNYFEDEDGSFWRSFVFIENAFCYQNAERPVLFSNSAKAFGKFQRMLDGFSVRKLHETIPDFHNTSKRFEKFMISVEKDASGRAMSVKREIDFVVSRKHECRVITDLLNSGVIPLRVTHNDTKLNNVLMDINTDEAICVIDLDTVMPGSVLYDFGDSIRFGANRSAEDEKDLNKVEFSLSLYEEYTKGYLSEARLTDKELEHLAWGARIITYEQGIRFLADYLDGDIYYRTYRAEQNLDRARVQFKMIEGMEKQFGEMQDIVWKYATL
jgi:thiamine kinase-like enzyme